MVDSIAITMWPSAAAFEFKFEFFEILFLLKFMHVYLKFNAKAASRCAPNNIEEFRNKESDFDFGS